MQELKEIFKLIDTMMVSCDIDYNELKNSKIDVEFFEEYQSVRIINSFLFNYARIQDKIGAKLFKKVLYYSKEIEVENIAMKDALNILEKLGIIEDTYSWDRLREIRNNLAHEYPFSIEERVENITLAIDGYGLLKAIYSNLKSYVENLEG
jgi:hypothetical protein